MGAQIHRRIRKEEQHALFGDVPAPVYDAEVTETAHEPAWCVPEQHIGDWRLFDEAAARLDHLDDGEDVYEVEKVVGRRGGNGRGDTTGLFRVRWRGWAPEEDTWETAAVLKDGSEEVLDEWLDWEKRVWAAIEDVKQNKPFNNPTDPKAEDGEGIGEPSSKRRRSGRISLPKAEDAEATGEPSSKHRRTRGTARTSLPNVHAEDAEVKGESSSKLRRTRAPARSSLGKLKVEVVIPTRRPVPITVDTSDSEVEVFMPSNRRKTRASTVTSVVDSDDGDWSPTDHRARTNTGASEVGNSDGDWSPTRRRPRTSSGAKVERTPTRRSARTSLRATEPETDEEWSPTRRRPRTSTSAKKVERTPTRRSARASLRYNEPETESE